MKLIEEEKRSSRSVPSTLSPPVPFYTGTGGCKSVIEMTVPTHRSSGSSVCVSGGVLPPTGFSIKTFVYTK